MDLKSPPQAPVLQARSIAGNDILRCESFGLEVILKSMAGGGLV